MSSIRKVQLERLVLDMAYTLYSRGVRPTDTELTKHISEYLSEFPAGSPLPVPLQDEFSGTKSNTDELNKLINYTKINMDVLYEASVRQVDTILQLTKTMTEDVKRLKKRRRALESEINNYLLAAENTGDYFYSFGEPFASIDNVDLRLTSSQIDLEAGAVTIPAIPYMTTAVKPDEITLNGLSVELDGSSKQYEEISPFKNAVLSNFDNVFWGIKVATDRPGELIVKADISLPSGPTVSRVDYDPYGPSEVQAFITSDDLNFETVYTSSDPMAFLCVPERASGFTLNLRKTQYDYTQIVDGRTVYYYLLGAKSLKVSKFVYDNASRIVSKPISIPEDIREDAVIDAVSLEVTESKPSRTDINYYVGASSGEADEAFSDIAWKQITPVGTSRQEDFVVNFNGTSRIVKEIRKSPRDNDLALRPIKTSGPLSERNPSALIVPGVNVFRIAEINDTAIPGSMSLIEGLNTVRIKSVDASQEDFESIDLEHWANITDATLDHARIDAGNDFFYGGDVGAVGKDVYVETFLNSDRTYDTFLETFTKIDARSQQWDVKVYLNGRELAYLEEGEDTAQLPWSIRQGLNHIVVLARIPKGADSTSFLGSVELMRDSKLYDYGVVRLSEWEYITPFEMQYNLKDNDAKVFTVLDGEIVSRRRPTDNFQVGYTLKSGQSPSFIRFRAEMTREQGVPSSTPVLNDYRIRFAYGEEEG